MKQNEKIKSKHDEECNHCDHGVLCNVLKQEDQKKIRLPGRNEFMQLYSAEALSYYFYFIPTLNPALK